MTYVIVTGTKSIVGKPTRSYADAFEEAVRRFGDDVSQWLALNLRIEENR